MNSTSYAEAPVHVSSGGWTTFPEGKPTEYRIAAPSPDAKYVVVDSHTKNVVYSTTYANRIKARRFADRKDAAYGAVRFICKFA